MAFGQAAIAGRSALPECPDAVAHVWGWFVELRNAVAHGEPVSFGEIAAYFDLTRQVPTPFEVGLIRRLDQAWMAEAARKAQAQQRRPSHRPSMLSHG